MLWNDALCLTVGGAPNGVYCMDLLRLCHVAASVA
jgi:hypothetical protein